MRVHHKAAARYARALLELAADIGVVDAVRADILQLRSLIRQSAELAAFLTNYTLPRSLRARALTELFGQRLQPLAFRFVMFIEQKRRLGLLDEIGESFLARDDERRGDARGRVASAFEISPEQIRAISAKAAGSVRGRLTLSPEVDPALLGGFRLRIGDMVYDWTLAGQLLAAKQRLAGR